MRDRYETARARLCVVGAVCAVLIIVGQAFQEIAYRFYLPEGSSPIAAIQIRNLPLDRTRAVVLIFVIVCMFFFFAATAFDRVRRAPGAAFVGFASFLMFCLFELWHRSIDFFLVSLRWAREYQATDIESVKQVLVERMAQWDAVTSAIYFPLVLTAAIGATCFALSMRGERGLPPRLALVAWTLDAVRLGVRTLGFAGIDALRAFSDEIYFPTITVIYGLLAFWLWRCYRAPSCANF